jgi:CheY-like chemotaxis protein
MLLHEVFEDEGFTVTCCSSTADAIQALQHLTPDLVVSDMQMEHLLAGLEFLRYLRQEACTYTIPFLMYSANALLLRTLEPQIAELIAVITTKPFDIDRVITLVHELIELKEREVS